MSKFSKRLEGLFRAQGQLTGACPAEQSQIKLRNTFRLPSLSRFQSGIISKPKITKVESHISHINCSYCTG